MKENKNSIFLCEASPTCLTWMIKRKGINNKKLRRTPASRSLPPSCRVDVDDWPTMRNFTGTSARSDTRKASWNWENRERVASESWRVADVCADTLFVSGGWQRRTLCLPFFTAHAFARCEERKKSLHVYKLLSFYWALLRDSRYKSKYNFKIQIS